MSPLSSADGNSVLSCHTSAALLLGLDNTLLAVNEIVVFVC